MAYNHSKKIGNQGDVVKHSVLYNCVLHLLSRSSPTETFVYGESHCGRASYTLPKVGEWVRGIGALSEKTEKARKAVPRIEAYLNVLPPWEQCKERQYPGSSNIVLTCLEMSSCKYQLHLFETDTDAYHDLTQAYAEWSPAIQLNNRDGYEGVASLASASLVLIDPPRLEEKHICSCIEKLRKKEISYICWTPRNSAPNRSKPPSPPNPDRPDNSRPVESSSSIDFGRRTDLGKQISVKWTNPTGAAQNTFGCRLTVSEDLYEIAMVCVKELVEIMPHKQPKRIKGERKADYDKRIEDKSSWIKWSLE